MSTNIINKSIIRKMLLAEGKAKFIEEEIKVMRKLLSVPDKKNLFEKAQKLLLKEPTVSGYIGIIISDVSPIEYDYDSSCWTYYVNYYLNNPVGNGLWCNVCGFRLTEEEILKITVQSVQ
jgi:hypothetical protein